MTSRPPKTADELREAFLSFFEEKEHLRLPSASLIPAADPTLLLINSGMAQFKAYFSGEKVPPRPRVTTSQKCFRTTDIEEVGDNTHLTMFEMLGNFSFGNYFKKEACAWALELLTERFGFDPERLYYTVYTTDNEAEQIWLDLGIPPERIYRFGDEERRLMHLVPAPAVRLMKSRVLSRPGQDSVWAVKQRPGLIVVTCKL